MLYKKTYFAFVLAILIVAISLQPVVAKDKDDKENGFGAITGYVTYVIYDQSEIVNTEIPQEEVEVYFVTPEENIDWDQTITCINPISGTLPNVDADDSGSRCTTTDYHTPTAYECAATKADGSTTTIYKTTTKTSAGNEGCFAARLPEDDYDIYVA